MMQNKRNVRFVDTKTKRNGSYYHLRIIAHPAFVYICLPFGRYIAVVRSCHHPTVAKVRGYRFRILFGQCVHNTRISWVFLFDKGCHFRNDSTLAVWFRNHRICKVGAIGGGSEEVVVSVEA